MPAQSLGKGRKVVEDGKIDCVQAPTRGEGRLIALKDCGEELFVLDQPLPNGIAAVSGELGHSEVPSSGVPHGVSSMQVGACDVDPGGIRASRQRVMGRPLHL